MDETQNQRHADMEPKGTFLLAVKQAAALWIKTLSRVSPTLVANIFFVWLFYLPALMLTPDLLEATRSILYEDMRNIVLTTSFWTSITLIAVQIFSVRFFRAALLGWIPGYVVDTALLFTFKMKSSVVGNIRFSSNLLFLCIGAFFIYRAKAPEPSKVSDNPPPVPEPSSEARLRDEELSWRLTKDGSVLALFKGIVVFFLIIAFLFYNILSLYLDSGFLAQLVFRFVVFPCCFRLSKWAQLKVLLHLPADQNAMDRRLTVNKVCNHYIQFIGRILVTNISSSRALSPRFIMVNIAAAVIEIVNTITLRYQIRVSFWVHQAMSHVKAAFIRSLKPSKTVPVAPFDNVEKSDIQHDPQDSKSPEEEYINEAISLRSRHIYDDIVSEIYSIIFAPLLMYFIHPLVSDSRFSPISSFTECINQIMVQLVCEVISDVVSLTLEIHRGHITQKGFYEWRPMGRSLLFVWTVFCLIHMHVRMVVYYA